MGAIESVGNQSTSSHCIRERSINRNAIVIGLITCMSFVSAGSYRVGNLRSAFADELTCNCIEVPGTDLRSAVSIDTELQLEQHLEVRTKMYTSNDGGSDSGAGFLRRGYKAQDFRVYWKRNDTTVDVPSGEFRMLMVGSKCDGQAQNKGIEVVMDFPIDWSPGGKFAEVQTQIPDDDPDLPNEPTTPNSCNDDQTSGLDFHGASGGSGGGMIVVLPQSFAEVQTQVDQNGTTLTLAWPTVVGYVACY